MDSASPFQPWASDDSAKNVKTETDLVDDAKLHRENVNHPKHTQTASYDKESVAVSTNAPGSSGAAGTGADSARSFETKMDSAKIASMQQIVENTISQEGRQRVAQLLEAVEALTGAERLLLYLRLPTGVPPHDPLKQPINPLGSRAELQQTVTWIQTHLEVDPDVSLPKQDVYDEYIAHCVSSNMKPLSTADFGKVMKQVYPTVRPRRLGTRGNSRYCYAGLRKKIKLEVPQLPDLSESSKEVNVTARETERIVCEWAETKLGVKFSNISELSRHLSTSAAPLAPPGPASSSPPPQSHLSQDDATSRHLMKQLKRKIQGTPGRPKKNKETTGESPPSTSYGAPHPPHKLEELAPEPGYAYQPPYVPVYEVRAPYPAYSAPPRAHPAPGGAYHFEPYAPRDLSLPAEPHNVPINLSSDASLDLRRRPPDPPPPRLPLPGKKLILETYQSETQAARPAPAPAYLPKKMRAAEILGGKLAAARLAAHDAPARSDAAFLEDPKNLTSRSTSTAAALAREQQEAASPTRAADAPTRARRRPEPEPDACLGLNIKTPVICEEKHSEILNRERVISICNIDKHDLDDYLNEGNSQEHEEELLRYFNQRDADADPDAVTQDAAAFLGTGQDPLDEHSQGKNEKISQLRELLAKNLKNQSGSANVVASNSQPDQEPHNSQETSHEQLLKPVPPSEGAFKPLVGGTSADVSSGPILPNQMVTMNGNKNGNMHPIENGAPMPYVNENAPKQNVANISSAQNYNGHSNTEPQSPTTRTQQYEFVPISDGCHSPGRFHSKSPLGFGQRGNSPIKVNKQIVMGGSLQTSPISHSTAASPFVSPRNTPVPRSRHCSRPIPKPGRKGRRNPPSLGMTDGKHFAMPNEQKFMCKTTQDIARQISVPNKYCQPMSAPPSPNILTSQYKPQMFGVPNGNGHHNLNFLPSTPFREHMNGDLTQPLSADPLSSEVSQFFPETPLQYRPGLDTSFRSQSVPLKPGMNNIGLLSYNNTPVGSVPPTPVPNEFCDFGNLTETCDISKACLNPETLDKIYNAIDSSNDVLNSNSTASLLNSNDHMRNGCDPLPDQQILSDEQLSSLIPNDELLDRNSQFNQSFNNNSAPDNVEDFLKRTNSLEFDLSELETDKNKYYTSRSVPSTPLPYKRTAPNLHIDPRRSRELFPAESYPAMSNGISSKSVPSTPQLADERNVFSYSNRDFLINGNSVCGSNQMHGIVVDNDQELTSPPYDMLQGDILEPLTLADLDNVDL
ncbi:uncharacterized protein LOC106138418 isoform X2 [Amyelois transitella]|uniref:uncharacterized protein LOC106138418 isoform X2 n=1 Tax=Amyelois transitella TaxID=680683 RepID=UPI00067E5B69|nr:uncharacterized protein LOC106138418 isoform X2 [Amyelois transitella]